MAKFASFVLIWITFAGFQVTEYRRNSASFQSETWFYHTDKILNEFGNITLVENFKWVIISWEFVTERFNLTQLMVRADRDQGREISETSAGIHSDI